MDPFCPKSEFPPGRLFHGGAREAVSTRVQGSSSLCAPATAGAARTTTPRSSREITTRPLPGRGGINPSIRPPKSAQWPLNTWCSLSRYVSVRLLVERAVRRPQQRSPPQNNGLWPRTAGELLPHQPHNAPLAYKGKARAPDCSYTQKCAADGLQGSSTRCPPGRIFVLR